ncbi:hypothetical protein [Mesorhizobium sp. J428]|uniref:hypothetical protein n=1 Tax=Mesorhizobium sp. J428 TaxID=2898440 RepID=UPI0021517728|nr:hypothetical protein [Mesorhizobium sp. J428]MCR5860470.1 hypothetical protein [Mesorhizobium sp. J428]
MTFKAVFVPGALDVVERAGLIDGMPFILMDDGSYDLNLNRFPAPVRAWARGRLTGQAFLVPKHTFSSGRAFQRATRG